MFIDSSGKKWFKGNLHTHTTRSDGQRSPQDTINLYRENGYDFISLTDHWKYNDNGFDGDMLVLAGCEYDFGKTTAPDDGIYHILSIGAEKDPELERSMTPQEALDKIKDAGGYTVLAHPAWSLNRPDNIEKFRNIDATEIFNSVSDLPRSCRAYSGAFVDMMAAGGTIFSLIADDDTHFYLGEECRSYIMVNAEELTKESILDAIRNEKFYSTQGPSISLTYDGETITARTSEVEKIIFHSNSCWVHERNFIAPEGMTVMKAVYRVPNSDTFVRAEAIDKSGKCAWSNIIKIK